MKTNLLKLALCAFVAALPIGAWAEEFDFGEEVSVSNKTLWTFESDTNFPTGTSYNVITSIKDAEGIESAYIRTSGVVTAVSPSISITLLDGTTKTITKSMKFANAIANASNLTATFTASGSVQDKNPTRIFAFNAEVPGTVYAWVKSDVTSGGAKTHRIYHKDLGVDSNGSLKSSQTTANGEVQLIAYTSSTKGSFFIGSAEANLEIYAVQFVPSNMPVSSPITWTSNNTPVTSIATIFNVGNGLVYRGSSKNITFTDENEKITFSDQTSVTVTKSFTCEDGKGINGGADKMEASTVLSNLTPTMAFYASVPGTVYAKIAATADDANGRIYFGAGAVNPTNTNASTNLIKNTITELKYTSTEAGSYYIGATKSFKLYAVRFVPSEKKTTIGSHGMSSFSCTQGLDFVNATPSGLKAYRAKEVGVSGLVVLSSVDEAPAGTGLILKGTASTEYTIPVKNDAASVGDNLLIATPAATTVAASTTGTYNYMWANGSKGIGFYNVNAATTSAAGKAYLSTTTALSTESGARSFVFEDDETTGINAVQGEGPKANGSETYYNLSGQRVAQPTHGLYIVNGKKVVIK